MYEDELPTRLVKQVAKIGDRAFLAVVELHHLCGAQRQKSQLSPFVSDSSFIFAYQDICIVCHCGCDTQVWEQRFGRRGDLCARNFVRRGFVTGTGNQLFDDDELGLWPGGGAQVFQYGKAILISPVVKYFADEEDGDVLLLRRLWLKEVVPLVNKLQRAALGQCRGILTNLGASRDQIQVRRACSSSRTMAHVLSGTYCIVTVPKQVGGFNPRTSAASPTTDSRSWTTKRSCG
jgi:hypothetical protein